MDMNADRLLISSSCGKAVHSARPEISKDRQVRWLRRLCRSRGLASLSLLLLVGSIGSVPRADATTLSYFGRSFDEVYNQMRFGNVYDRSMRILGALDIATLSDTSGSIVDVSPLIATYQFTDGVSLMTHNNSEIEASIAVDSSRRITDWQISISQFLTTDDPPVLDERRKIDIGTSPIFGHVFDTGAVTVCVGEDPFGGFCDMDMQNRGSATKGPGMLTVVPLPPAAPLFLAAITILSYVGWRKKNAGSA